MIVATALLLSAVLGYFCGSIPFGYLAGRLKGIDLREHGSGNIGATNAVRVLGKPIGLTVFLFDFLKGLMPVCVASWVLTNSQWTTGWEIELCAVVAGISAILGHTYTCWLGGKGGKGVATSIGTLFALMSAEPIGLTCVLLIWIVSFAISRYVSLASMLAAGSLPIIVLISNFQSGNWNIPLIVFSLLVAFLVIWRHRSNITRLCNGTENRAFSKRVKDQ